MFDGTKVPEDAKCWLFVIKEQLEVIRTLKKMRVKFAATKLTGNAYRWWRLVKQSEGIRKWQEFENAFRLQFISNAYRRAKRDELRNLVQGDMSVEEYASNLKNLACTWILFL